MDSSADSIHPTPDGGSSIDDAGDGPHHDKNPRTPLDVITITVKSDLVLDVAFENTKNTLRTARKSVGAVVPGPKPKSRQAFRVDSATLRAQSRYFDKLLSDTRFREARDVATAFSNLEKRGLRPFDVQDPADLPWIQIEDDDEATGFAHRDIVFAELLKILHRPPSAPTPAAPASPAGPTSRDGKAKKGAVTSGPAKKKPGATTAAAKPPVRSATKASVSALDPPVPAPAPSGPKITMPFVTTLAVLADRFDCIASVSRALNTGILRFKWPATALTPPPVVNLSKPGSGTSSGPGALRDDRTPTLSRQTEDILRQKILVSWLLDQPLRLQAATRELIMNGSCRWTSFGPAEGEEDDFTGGFENGPGGTNGTGGQQLPTWWFLRDGLEEELQYRRECILNTIASVQRHFLALYTARRGGSGGSTQCKLGYDSSPACDSYQLGEMLRFLSHKGLLYMIDFSPSSLDRIPETALLPIDNLLASLRMCPSYQIDKHHSNCGFRTRLLPILDFIQNSLLNAGSVPISRRHWATDRQAASWIPTDDNDHDDGGGGGSESRITERMRGWKGLGDDDEDGGGLATTTTNHNSKSGGGGGMRKPFRFTRSMAADQRLRLANNIGADKFAREVFTASSWDWTAEDG